MEAILQALSAITAPLSSEMVLGAIVAGLFFGAIYNHSLRLPISFSYHSLIYGLGFILFLFLFRLGSALLAGAVIVNPWGWVGIGLLWALFCTFIWIGHMATDNIK